MSGPEDGDEKVACFKMFLHNKEKGSIKIPKDKPNIVQGEKYEKGAREWYPL